mmetsp:Transcript_18459/g.58108  ORF Transcript_18459/g.58108 Transcript_18459/m.58108 type:complete len:209 (-) Transcript_18459:741-1367(-)
MRTPWWASYRSRRPRRMATVASIEGSPTWTFWKRRSKALSRSTCSRYSSSVVAPMTRSWPRARSGLRRFPASMAPSVRPAPMTVWISSMKQTTPGGGADVISPSTALSRSSNSPRYFAPAIRAPMSRDHSFTPRIPSGTSSSTMRAARPSATAVLPTPGGPTSTGLFFVRRDRTWTTRRISSSRPITGSSFPSRASCVMSSPYLFSAS